MSTLKVTRRKYHFRCWIWTITTAYIWIYLHEICTNPNRPVGVQNKLTLIHTQNSEISKLSVNVFPLVHLVKPGSSWWQMPISGCKEMNAKTFSIGSMCSISFYCLYFTVISKHRGFMRSQCNLGNADIIV